MESQDRNHGRGQIGTLPLAIWIWFVSLIMKQNIHSHSRTDLPHSLKIILFAHPDNNTLATPL